MKNLYEKLLNHLERFNNIKPNHCQHKAAKLIHSVLQKQQNLGFFNLFYKKKNLYLFGSFGVGKSVLLKALDFIHPNSVIFHFTDLIFHLQKDYFGSKDGSIKLKKCKVILIDEFFIDNLTNLVLFENFFNFAEKKNILLIITSNKELSKIYEDPLNPKLVDKIKSLFLKNFVSYNMKSKIDYRSKKKKSENFFFEGCSTSVKRKQDKIIKRYAITTIASDLSLERAGYKINIDSFYGNIIDINFKDFFKRNLVFKDYELISTKAKIFIIRNLRSSDCNNSNLVARFIFFIDVLYENKNILSLSTELELDKINVAKKNSFEFKRTVSRLKEMGSSEYIKENLKNVFKKYEKS